MKMNLIFKSAALALVATFYTINVNAQSKTVAITSFNSIGVSSGIDLYLTQGTTETLVIKGDNDLIKDVIVEQNGTSLNIKYKDGINWSRMFKNQAIKVYVNYKTLKSIAASGGSDVYTQNTLKSTDLNIAASGGSDVTLTLNVTNLQLAISGGADADLKGTGENMVITASGGSDVDAYDFVVNNAKVNASGGSDANIHVNKALEASASGGGDVNYKGNPTVKKNNSRSGDVNHVN